MIEKPSEERLEKFKQMIMNPRPGSKVAAALEFGTDLTLTLGQLKRTPQERLDNQQSAMRGLEEITRAGAELRKRSNGRI